MKPSIILSALLLASTQWPAWAQQPATAPAADSTTTDGGGVQLDVVVETHAGDLSRQWGHFGPGVRAP